jgi:RimK family alpha-L-glutamate ligase
MVGLKIGILGRDISGWGTQQLKDSFQRRGVFSVFFSFSNITARVGYSPVATVKNVDVIQDLAALIIRPIGRGSLEEIIFRMDFLHRLERLGVLIVNPVDAIEQSVDKYHALTLLEEKGLPVPRTVVTEDFGAALECFKEVGGDIVLKPLFGSKGIGSTRITDVNIAERIFSSVLFHHEVLYLQEFIPHGNSDIRAFVVGKKVVAAMRRIADSWKTNVSQGAQPVALKLSEELETLAVKATEVVGCKVAGVDILEGENGPMVIELNSQPGWRGLQSVSDVNIADCIVDYVMAEARK